MSILIHVLFTAGVCRVLQYSMTVAHDDTNEYMDIEKTHSDINDLLLSITGYRFIVTMIHKTLKLYLDI